MSVHYITLPTSRAVKQFEESACGLSDCSFQIDHIVSKFFETFSDFFSSRAENPVSFHAVEHFIGSILYDGYADYLPNAEDPLFRRFASELYVNLAYILTSSYDPTMEESFELERLYANSDAMVRVTTIQRLGRSNHAIEGTGD